MNTFLYTGAVKAIPEALDEAAMIDGANPIQTFSRIIFPVLKPTTATVAILSFMWTWNDFTMPLVLLSDESQTDITACTVRIQETVLCRLQPGIRVLSAGSCFLY